MKLTQLTNTYMVEGVLDDLPDGEELDTDFIDDYTKTSSDHKERRSDQMKDYSDHGWSKNQAGEQLKRRKEMQSRNGRPELKPEPTKDDHKAQLANDRSKQLNRLNKLPGNVRDDVKTQLDSLVGDASKGSISVADYQEISADAASRMMKYGIKYLDALIDPSVNEIEVEDVLRKIIGGQRATARVANVLWQERQRK